MNPVDLAALVPLVLLGGVLGLDVVSFPQAMLSRPLVGATLAGIVAGDGLSGLLVGATLELIALETLPVGASRYPEWGSASVAGGALFAFSHDAMAGSMVVAVLAALAVAWFGGWTMVMLRRLNGLLARRSMDALARGSSTTVVRLQITGLVMDFLRAAALTLLALLLFAPLQAMLLTLWETDARLSRAFVVGVAATVALAAGWKLFRGTPGARWLFLGGLAASLLMVGAR